MIQISDNTQQIQPSKIRKMFNKALEYDHVISFTLGEPDFTASSNVVELGAGPFGKERPSIQKMQGCWLCARRLQSISIAQRDSLTILQAKLW